MTTFNAQADATKHRQPRVLSPSLKIAVVQKKLIGPNHYEFCELMDISQSGACIASQWLNTKLGQKLDLEFYHGSQKYASRGVVSRISTRENFDHYGVVFIYAPRELDLLIASFINEKAQTLVGNPSVTENPKKRQMGHRIALPDAQVYAKKSDSSDPFLLCQVDNISKGGMGFYCSSRLGKEAPFTISIQIAAHCDNSVITGLVHHMSKKVDAYYYGIEFELVSMEFIQILEQLDGINDVE